MSIAQRNDGPHRAVVTLSLADPRPVRLALVQNLADSGRLVTRLAERHTLDALDDETCTMLDVTLGNASTLVEVVGELDGHDRSAAAVGGRAGQGVNSWVKWLPLGGRGIAAGIAGLAVALAAAGIVTRLAAGRRATFRRWRAG